MVRVPYLLALNERTLFTNSSRVFPLVANNPVHSRIKNQVSGAPADWFSYTSPVADEAASSQAEAALWSVSSTTCGKGGKPAPKLPTPDERSPLRNRCPKPVGLSDSLARGFCDPIGSLPAEEGTLLNMSATAGDLKPSNPPMPGPLPGVMLSKKSFIDADWVNPLAGKDNVLGTVPPVPPAGADETATPHCEYASWAGAKMPATMITMTAKTDMDRISCLSFLLFSKRRHAFFLVNCFLT